MNRRVFLQGVMATVASASLLREPERHPLHADVFVADEPVPGSDYAAICNPGELAFAESVVYVCTEQGTWKRLWLVQGW